MRKLFSSFPFHYTGWHGFFEYVWMNKMVANFSTYGETFMEIPKRTVKNRKNYIPKAAVHGETRIGYSPKKKWKEENISLLKRKEKII